MMNLKDLQKTHEELVRKEEQNEKAWVQAAIARGEVYLKAKEDLKTNAKVAKAFGVTAPTVARYINFAENKTELKAFLKVQKKKTSRAEVERFVKKVKKEKDPEYAKKSESAKKAAKKRSVKKEDSSEVAELKRQLKELKKENRELKKENKVLKAEVERVKEANAYLFGMLKVEFKTFLKTHGFTEENAERKFNYFVEELKLEKPENPGLLNDWYAKRSEKRRDLLFAVDWLVELEIERELSLETLALAEESYFKVQNELYHLASLFGRYDPKDPFKGVDGESFVGELVVVIANAVVTEVLENGVTDTGEIFAKVSKVLAHTKLESFAGHLVAGVAKSVQETTESLKNIEKGVRRFFSNPRKVKELKQYLLNTPVRKALFEKH